MAWFDDLLLDLEPRRWSAATGLPKSVEPGQLFVQSADYGLEVAFASAPARPSSTDVRKAWKARHGGRPSPVLLAVGYPEGEETRVALCGPAGADPPVHIDLEVDRVERLAATALSEPNRHSAQRCLVRMLPEVDSDMPGLHNSGLLATHELHAGVPKRADWEQATKEGRNKLRLRRRQLLEGLGYSVESLSTNTSLLKAGPERRALAVFLDEGESFEAPGMRFEGASPVSHALAIATKEKLPWVIATRASEIRLYTTRTDTAVGRKGQGEAFVEANLALLPEKLAGYLELLFSAEALSDGGSFGDILGRSADFAASVAVNLRERVYKETVPTLAKAISARLKGEVDQSKLDDAYEQTLTVLFRLLFVAYGEDKELLPLRTNGRYEDHSLKVIARRLAEDVNYNRLAFDEHATDLWTDVAQLWRAVDKGNTGWGVPKYNGGLFSTDEQESAAGFSLTKVQLTDAEFGPALVALLTQPTEDGWVGPVDFRTLSVREFGTIYEGLLESELSVAPTDLSLDDKGSYVPAKGKSSIVERAGSVYLHNRSGARKATGSYFTKPFAVEHLLDHALEPALTEHIGRVAQLVVAGDDAAAAEVFFDFRCADIAMGSGHFLVAAIDRIEARLGAFLALNPIPAVTAELERLRERAEAELGELSPGSEMETTSLMRRQVARRCIYGVDKNHISVELARLAIWIHTFVPGLPLSFLDHNLVVGDSLTGIGTVEEAHAALAGGDADAPSLFADEINSFLQRASVPLRRLATLSDASIADVKAARAAHDEAQANAEPAAALFDLLVAHRLGECPLPESIDESSLLAEAERIGAYQLAADVKALHFPFAFPEVFLRERAGFDCILGNPPWEKLQVEEHSFYSLHYPGLRGLSQRKAELEIRRLRSARPDLVMQYRQAQEEMALQLNLLTSGAYPGLSAGRPDLYKAFAWRFWTLTGDDGSFGIVLPRKAFEGAGSKKWRECVLGASTIDITMLLNSRGWVFDDAEHRYTIGLAALRKGSNTGVSMRGPFVRMSAYQEGMRRSAQHVEASLLSEWSSTSAFPILSSEASQRIFLRIRRHKSLRFDDHKWDVRGMRELNATDDKEHFVFESQEGHDHLWPVYKGKSFDLWNPETGSVYAYCDPVTIVAVLEARRSNQVRNSRSSFFGMESWQRNATTLPALSPRIAWRDSTNRTNSRTVVGALVPSNTVLVHQAYTLFFRKGDERDEAYVLGWMCALPTDWYARQVVENHVTVGFMNSAPIPLRDREDPLQRRVEQIAGRLAAVDERFAGWADAVGVPVGSVTEAEKPDLLAELDACVGLLYGLDETDIAVIYDTFHEGADYTTRKNAVLDHMRTSSRV